MSKCQCLPHYHGYYCELTKSMECDHNWTKNEIGTCVKFFKDEKNYENAVTECQDNKGWLLGLNTNFKDKKFLDKTSKKLVAAIKDVNYFIKDYNLWIGLENHRDIIYSKSDFPRFYGKIKEKDILGYDIEYFNGNETCPYVPLKFFSNRRSSQIYKVSQCKNKKIFVCEKFPINYSVIENSKLCPKGWFFSEYFESCLLYNPTSLDLDEATQFCKRHDSHLPSLLKKSLLFYMYEANFLADRNLGCGLNNLCKNGGTCVYTNNNFSKCICEKFFIGEFCEKSIYEVCNSNPCGGNGQCIPVPTEYGQDYLCNCKEGLKQKSCPIDICSSSSPCVNGDCINRPDTKDGFVCKCLNGYSGKHCDLQRELPDCSAQIKCGYGRICKGYISESNENFECLCPSGKYGSSCQYITPQNHSCKNNPCKNNGFCVVTTADSYQCMCQKLYIGKNCETRLPRDTCQVETTLMECPVCEVEGNFQDCLKLSSSIQGCVSDQNNRMKITFLILS